MKIRISNLKRSYYMLLYRLGPDGTKNVINVDNYPKYVDEEKKYCKQEIDLYNHALVSNMLEVDKVIAAKALVRKRYEFAVSKGLIDEEDK